MLDRQQCVGCAWHGLVPSPSSVPFFTAAALARFSVPGRGSSLLSLSCDWGVAPRQQTCGSVKNPGLPLMGWASLCSFGKGGARTGGPAGRGTSCRVAQSKGVCVRACPGSPPCTVRLREGGRPGPRRHLLPPDSEAWPHFSQASPSFLNSLVIPRDSRVPQATGVLSNTPPSAEASWQAFLGSDLHARCVEELTLIPINSGGKKWASG